MKSEFLTISKASPLPDGNRSSLIVGVSSSDQHFFLFLKQERSALLSFILLRLSCTWKIEKNNGCCILALKAIKVGKNLSNLPLKSHSIRNSSEWFHLK